MRSFSEAAFSKLTVAEKVRIANLTINASVMNTTLAMCDPHSSMRDYAGDRMAELADCVYIMGDKLKGASQPAPPAIATSHGSSVDETDDFQGNS